MVANALFFVLGNNSALEQWRLRIADRIEFYLLLQGPQILISLHLKDDKLLLQDI